MKTIILMNGGEDQSEFVSNSNTPGPGEKISQQVILPPGSKLNEVTLPDGGKLEELTLSNGEKFQVYSDKNGKFIKEIVNYPDGKIETHTIESGVEHIRIQEPDGTVTNINMTGKAHS